MIALIGQDKPERIDSTIAFYAGYWTEWCICFFVVVVYCVVRQLERSVGKNIMTKILGALNFRLTWE